MMGSKITLHACLLTLSLTLVTTQSAEGFWWKKHRRYGYYPTTGMTFSGGRVAATEVFLTEMFPTVETFRSYGTVRTFGGSSGVSNEALREFAEAVVAETKRQGTESQSGNTGTGNNGNGGSSSSGSSSSGSCDHLSSKVDKLIERVEKLEGKVDRIHSWIQARQEEERESQRLRAFAEIVLASQRQQNQAISQALMDSLKIVKPDLNPDQLKELDAIMKRAFPSN